MESYEVDEAMLAKYQAQTALVGSQLSLGEEIVHGAVAAVTDFGTSVWNSTAGVVSEDYSTSTADLLSRIDKDALQVYNEHPDAIHTASFIGGVFVPAGLAFKGMNALRAGQRGVSWFSKAGETANLAKVESAFANSTAGASEALNLAKTNIYKAMAANVLVDNVAAEAAIVLTMNAHPYMEDYMEDLPSNFLLGVAIGGGIGGVVGTIGAKASMRGVTAPIAKEAEAFVSSEEKVISDVMNIGDQLKVREMNIKMWESKLADSQSDVQKQLNPFTQAYLEHAITSNKSYMVEDFAKMSKGQLAETSQEMKDTVMNLMKEDIRFINADSVSYLGSSREFIAPKKRFGLLPEAAIPSFFKKETTKAGEQVIKGNQLMFSREHNTFVSIKEADDFSVLADYSNKIEDFKTGSKQEFSLPRSDAFMDRQYMAASDIAADEVRAFFYVDSLSVQDINKLVVHPDDLAMTRALTAKINSLPAGDAEKVAITFTREAPTWEAKTKAVVKAAGFSPKYLDHLKELDKGRKEFQLLQGQADVLGKNKDLSRPAETMLDDWIGGDLSKLRKLALAHIHPELNIPHNEELMKSFLEIKNSPKSEAFRNRLRQFADAEGNVLLYRGMTAAPKGHSPVESYSLSAGKAGSFGSTRMYRVHVDDVLATIEDIGYLNMSNSEILVLNRATRENAVIPAADASFTPSKFFSSEDELILNTAPDIASSTFKGGLKEIQQSLVEAELRMAESLKKTGAFSDEAIANRVGVRKLEEAGSGMARYTSEPQILAEISEANRSLVVGTNLNKVPFAELRSSLSNKNMEDMNSEVIDMVLKSSPDSFVRGLREELFTKESQFLSNELLKQIDQVTSEGLRSTFFRSANSVVEDFGVAGTIATRIGQDVTHYINKAKESLVAPIHAKMGKIVKNEALTVETNMAMTVNASIAGPRTYRDGQFWVKELKRQADGTEAMVEVAVKYKGQEFKIQSQEVLDLFDSFNTAGRSMYHLNNSANKILGKPAMSDIGFWIPAFNPRNKEIAYIVEHAHGRPTTSILWGKTSAELNDKIKMFEAQAKNEGRNVTVLAKDKNLEHFNKINGREDPMSMQVADISMQHTGSSASALVSTNVELLSEVINSYDHLISKGITNLVDIQLSPVMNRLQRISERSQALHNAQSFGIVQKAISSKADPGMVMRNILLGKGLISEHTTWQSTQQGLQVFTDMALENLSKAAQPLVNLVSKGHGRTEETFIQLNKELEAKGLIPFKAVEDFVRYQQEGHIVSTSLTPRAVALSNSLAATMLLKFMELAQPFVNMISLPILTSGAMRKQMAAEFMGSKLAGNPQFKLAETVYDAVRMMGTDEGKRWMGLGEKRGLYTPMVSEANAAMAQARSLDPGLMAKAEAAMESSFVKFMSKPADFSEEMVRRMSFMNGVVLAKKAYPGLNDTGVMTFARSFMDEALGNYAAAQRPAFFQGTFGVAMGIFQTYMLTLGQQMFRGIEARDWVGLSKQMFAQATIFGGSALPGFHLVSEQIGTHFSDNHVDLETGLVRAVGDENATTLLYGLPASLGMGITTRGDIQPRVPNPLMGIDSLAAVNLTKQAYQAGKGITEAAFTADASTGRAMLEALSVQSISRPLARFSELVTGRSMTSAGITVASNTTVNPFSEEFVLHGAIARVMATRPIEEVKAREAMHLDSVYKAVDGDKRKALVKRLRTYIQDGNLNAENIQELQYEYLRTGSPTGWRASVNDAMRMRVMGGDFAVKDRLHPNAPYQAMVDDLG